MRNSTRLVIFDCDGTLVDSQHMICAAMQHAFSDHALPCPPREKLLSIVGLSLAEAFHRLGEGIERFPVGSLVERYKAAFFMLRARGEDMEPLYPGAREAIDRLAARQDIVLGMATGKSQRGVRAVLGRHGLLDRFQTIKTADDAPSKPHPGMVLEALREAGVEASSAIVVGDTTYDIDMARAAGTFAVGVGWGYHAAAALRACGAHAVIDNFADLSAAIGTIWPHHGPDR